MTREIRYRHHSRVVSLWIEAFVSEDADVQSSVETFEKIIGAILNVVRIPVGDATLAAILDRVTYNSTGQFPMLKGTEIGEGSLVFTELAKNNNLKISDVRDAFHYLMTELLFIVGNLTGETLAPRLHAVLDPEKKN